MSRAGWCEEIELERVIKELRELYNPQQPPAAGGTTKYDPDESCQREYELLRCPWADDPTYPLDDSAFEYPCDVTVKNDTLVSSDYYSNGSIRREAPFESDWHLG